MHFKAGSLLIISAQICTTLALPPCTCTRNLNPVCGSDGVDYSNECLLRCAATNSGTTITVAKHGPCVGSLAELGFPEACICHNMYDPVCGSDGKTYSNECELNCQNVRFHPSLKVERRGTCGAPLIFNPVCGSDGLTYNDSAQLNAAAKFKLALTVAHDGPCVPNTKHV